MQISSLRLRSSSLPKLTSSLLWSCPLVATSNMKCLSICSKSLPWGFVAPLYQNRLPLSFDLVLWFLYRTWSVCPFVEMPFHWSIQTSTSSLHCCCHLVAATSYTQSLSSRDIAPTWRNLAAFYKHRLPCCCPVTTSTSTSTTKYQTVFQKQNINWQIFAHQLDVMLIHIRVEFDQG